MLERIFGKKEAAKKYIPAVNDLYEILSTNLDKLHDDILFWTGSEGNPEAKFKASVHGNGVDIKLDAGGQFSKVFEIGIGATGLFFENRTLLPGFQVFKLKKYTEIHNRTGVEETIKNFVEKKPEPDEIKDIRLETFKQRMVANQNTSENKISISVGRAPKHQAKK